MQYSLDTSCSIIFWMELFLQLGLVSSVGGLVVPPRVHPAGLLSSSCSACLNCSSCASQFKSCAEEYVARRQTEHHGGDQAPSDRCHLI